MTWRGTNKNPVVVKIADGNTDESNETIGYEQIKNLATAKHLNPPDGATVATVIPEAAGVRVRKDGVDPTGSVGMPVPVGGGMKLYGNEIAAAVFIEQSPGAILHVEYGDVR